MNVIEIAALILTALVLVSLIAVFVDLTRVYQAGKRRRRAERIEEEATAIAAALVAFEKIREAKSKSDGNKKEVRNEEDKTL